MKLTCSLGKPIDIQFSIKWLAPQFSHDGPPITVYAHLACDFTNSSTYFTKATICAFTDAVLSNSYIPDALNGTTLSDENIECVVVINSNKFMVCCTDFPMNDPPVDEPT